MKATWGLVGAAVVMSWAAQAAAQFPPPGGGPPPTPRASAPIDLTGVWVSIVNEDWRWRMITAPRGDFPGLPLSPAGRAIAMAWDPKTDGSCKAFGAAAVMRMPTRVRISWADDVTLKIETDNGQQTRLLHFGAGRPPGAPSLQGDSAADWQRTLPPNNPFGINFPGGPPPPPGGSLRVVTTNLSGGWLRRNGVPLQRKDHRHRVLRSFSRARRLRMVRGHDAGRRSRVSARSPRDQLALPPRTRRLEVGAETV
jgi:hypothetical protein